MDGNLTQEEFEKAISLAIEGCKKVYAIQKEVLKAKYVSVKEAEE
jgi:exosome complex component RRP41